MTEVVLIVAPTKCSKCDACRKMCAEIEERFPGEIRVRIFDTNAPECASYGVVLPPTMVVDDFIVAAGALPRKDAVLKLVEQQVGG